MKPPNITTGACTIRSIDVCIYFFDDLTLFNKTCVNTPAVADGGTIYGVICLCSQIALEVRTPFSSSRQFTADLMTSSFVLYSKNAKLNKKKKQWWLDLPENYIPESKYR